MTTTDRLLQHPTVEAGLSAEEALLESVCAGERSLECLAWSPRDYALVMPRRHQRLDGFAQARERLAELGWPVLFRATGGTPVPLGPMVVNVALAVRCQVRSSAAHLEWGYHRLGDPWCDWLRSLGVTSADLGNVSGAYCDGRFNVRIAERKLVGTAQRWRRVRGSRDMALLVHGSMQVAGQPKALVDVVNTFQAVVEDAQRFLPESHIALKDALPELDIDTALPGLVERLLSGGGMSTRST